MSPNIAAQLHQLFFFVGGLLAFFSVDRQALPVGLAIVVISFGPGCTLFASRSIEIANRYLTVSFIVLVVLYAYLLISGSSFFDAMTLRAANSRDVSVGIAICYGYCLAGIVFRLFIALGLTTSDSDVERADEFEDADDDVFIKTLRFRIWLSAALGVIVVILLLF